MLIRQDMLQIQHTMWNYAGVVRSPKRLTRARRILLELREEIQSFYRGCGLTRDLIELRNAVQTALLVVHAAALNPRQQGLPLRGRRRLEGFPGQSEIRSRAAGLTARS